MECKQTTQDIKNNSKHDSEVTRWTTRDSERKQQITTWLLQTSDTNSPENASTKATRKNQLLELETAATTTKTTQTRIGNDSVNDETE